MNTYKINKKKYNLLCQLGSGKPPFRFLVIGGYPKLYGQGFFEVGPHSSANYGSGQDWNNIAFWIQLYTHFGKTGMKFDGIIFDDKSFPQINTFSIEIIVKILSIFALYLNDNGIIIIKAYNAKTLKNINTFHTQLIGSFEFKNTEPCEFRLNGEHTGDVFRIFQKINGILPIKTQSIYNIDLNNQLITVDSKNNLIYDTTKPNVDESTLTEFLISRFDEINQCKKCTFINKKGKQMCEVCNNPLSPVPKTQETKAPAPKKSETKAPAPKKPETKAPETKTDNLSKYNRSNQKGDGNCLFRSLCEILGLGADNHATLRNMIMIYIKENKNELIKIGWFIEQLNSMHKSIDEYIVYMATDCIWGGLIEIYITSRIYQRKIYIVEESGNLNYQVVDLFKHLFIKSSIPLYIFYYRKNHYDVLTPKQIAREEKKQNLYLGLESGSIELHDTKANVNTQPATKLKENFMEQIRLNKDIKKETKLNIVFYSAGNAQAEIYLIETLLSEGYLVNNVILIDNLYNAPDLTILQKMRKEIHELYGINVMLLGSYNKYIKWLNDFKEPIHLILSIHFQHIGYMSRDMNIENYAVNTFTDMSEYTHIINAYTKKTNLVPSKIIRYDNGQNSQIIQQLQDLIEFHTNLVTSLQTSLIDVLQFITSNTEKLQRVLNKFEEINPTLYVKFRLQNSDFFKKIQSGGSLEATESLQKYITKMNKINDNIAKNKYIKYKNKYINLKYNIT